MHKENLLIPRSPFFGSGPTKKYSGWSLSELSDAFLARSHRSALGISCLQEVIDLTRDVLQIPIDYKIAILPGSATGAIECALWSFLGERGVDVFSWDIFGKLWIVDIVDQLKIENTRIFEASSFGEIPDLYQYAPNRDVVFTWNGTTSGVCVSHLDWIPNNRKGLTICDATSAAFCVPLEWKKLDITTFSWQKGLGGEAGHGMMVLSPQALKRLETNAPSWPIPRLLRLKRNNMIIEGVFSGETLNTPSMLCVADCRNALRWAKSIGGLDELVKRCQTNFQVIKTWVEASSFVHFSATSPLTTSPTSVVFKLKDSLFPPEKQREIIKQIAHELSEKEIAYDISNHSLAPAAFRIWCGPTVEQTDIAALLPWIERFLHIMHSQ